MHTYIHVQIHYTCTDICAICIIQMYVYIEIAPSVEPIIDCCSNDHCFGTFCTWLGSLVAVSWGSFGKLWSMYNSYEFFGWDRSLINTYHVCLILAAYGAQSWSFVVRSIWRFAMVDCLGFMSHGLIYGTSDLHFAKDLFQRSAVPSLLAKGPDIVF